MKILIVDDSKKHRQAAQIQLEALGHEVVVMSCYSEVFRRIDKIGSPDAALVDLMMPAESMTLGERGMEFFGQQMMVGYPLSIFLAKSGIARVAVVTDTNHHDHPASAILDFFLGKPLEVNGAHVHFLHAQLMVDGCKDWAKSLEKIMAG